MRGIYGSSARTQVVNNLQKKHASKELTPAQSLYRLWETVLDGLGEDAATFGVSPGYGIGMASAGPGLGTSWRVINFGYYYSRRSTVSDMLQIDSRGYFRVGYLHGWAQRDALSRNSFLNWAHEWSQYHWRVSTSSNDGSYNAQWITDWNIPAHYMSERLLWSPHGKWHVVQRPWMKLVPDKEDPSGWRIAFAENESPDGWKPEHYEAHDRLIEQRRRRLRRHWEIETGVTPPPVPRESVDVEERHERHTEFLVAHLNITTPARSIPLRKPSREEPLWEPSGCP